MIYNFIEVNHDVEINGMKIDEIFGTTYKEFNENIVIKDGEDAKDAIYVVAPIVLRIQISIVMCDVNDVRPV